MQQIKVEDIVIGNDDPPRAVDRVEPARRRTSARCSACPPSGKRIERTIAFILTLRDGLITKEIRIYDFTSMLMQLGALRAKPAHG